MNAEAKRNIVQWIKKNPVVVVLILFSVSILLIGLWSKGKKVLDESPISEIALDDPEIEEGPDNIETIEEANKEKMRSNTYKKKREEEVVGLNISKGYKKLPEKQAEKNKQEEPQKEIKEEQYLTNESPVNVKKNTKSKKKKKEPIITEVEETNGFGIVYGKRPSGKAPNDQKFFQAVINEDSKVKPGTTVPIRLAEDMIIGDELFKRNTILYGKAEINNERINIDITNIKGVPVSVSVYDKYYAEGISYDEDKLEESIKKSGAESFSDASDEIPYGLVQKIGKNVINNIGKKKHVFLADGYKIFLANK